MGELVLQIWEESTLGDCIRQDGCSLHLNRELRNKYINDYYSSFGDVVPKIYERAVGEPCDVLVDNQLFNKVREQGSIRLMQNQLSNLFDMCDIIVKGD